MSERLREIVERLPLQGVGIHGTNEARAKIIAREGFKKLKVNPNLTPLGAWYLAQGPIYREETPYILKEHVNESIHFSLRASINPAYYVPEDPLSSTIPVIVLFKPLMEFVKIESTLNSSRERGYEREPIPPENVYGYIKIDPYHTTDFVLRNVYKILRRKGIIEKPTNSARPQQPQAK